tara:strand:- start:248 stop:1159 length:912 start_codon:yes stop_codon:yes gene_type:complete
MKVGVAISSFNSDQEVIQLINKIREEQWPISGIIIVDSMGSNEIQNYLLSNNMQDIEYHNFNYNLGSAGNLHQRIHLASKHDWDFVLALNHDALVTKSTLIAQLEYVNLEKIGALYPLKFFPEKQFYDYSGTKEVGPWRAFGPINEPEEPLVSHIWSSSNGALYSLEAARNGILPNQDLWFGWDDYLYGLDLRKSGYKQFVVTKAICEDNYEFESRSLGPMTLKLSIKPAWYHYYRTRNLWWIAFYRHPSLLRILRVSIRTIAETFSICLGWEKDNKFLALKYQFIGMMHGIFNKMGKWKVPE